MFKLDERLRADTAEVASIGLCAVRLMNDRTMPWLILVPQVEGAQEIYELDGAHRSTLMDEITLASRVMKDIYKPDKLNVANLGNIVSQLHVHIIARRSNDRAWPGPVWGAPGGAQYAEKELEAALFTLRASFNLAKQSYLLKKP